MSAILILTIGSILFFSSVIQGIVGFAFNLFAIPLLIWSGLSLSESISISAIPIFAQSLTATIKLKDHVRWKEVGIASLIRALAIPIGIFILTLVDSFDKESIKQFVGIAILFVVLSQIYLKIEPKEKITFAWTFITFFTSGIAQGLVAMGGPPAVLWVMTHKWNTLTSRAFLNALFLIGGPLQIFLLYYSFGKSLLNFFFTGLAFTPVVIISTLLGIKLGNYLDRVLLKKIVIYLLILTSCISIFSPYLNKILALY